MRYFAHIQFDHGISLTEEQWKELFELCVPDEPFEKWLKDNTTDEGKICSWRDFLVDLDEFVKVFKNGYSVKKLRQIKEYATASDFVERQVGPQFNERVHVAVAGAGLMQITKVHVEYDLCTDALQRLLDDGWRIVACCVQPDRRRPDYVLGRPS